MISLVRFTSGCTTGYGYSGPKSIRGKKRLYDIRTPYRNVPQIARMIWDFSGGFVGIPAAKKPRFSLLAGLETFKCGNNLPQ